MTARLVTIFGGSGFLGRSVVRRLAAEGCRVRVAVRRPNEAQNCKPMGDVGQIQTVYADVAKPETVALAIQGADAVINLAGILFERGHNTFEAVHKDGAAHVAKAAANAGVPVLVHISALGAEGAEARYAESKMAGEAAVREAFPNAVIIRPSVLFGPDDQFFNRFAMLNKWLPVIALPHLSTRYQPVYVGDAAQAIVTAAKGGKGISGETFSLGGPDVMTLREIIAFVQETTGVKKPVACIPAALLKAQAFLLSLFTWPLFFEAPLVTIDQVRMMGYDSVVPKGAKGLGALGVKKPETAAAIVPSYLARFRKYGEFADS